jgi:SOS response regulatory protein OraA/RecX
MKQKNSSSAYVKALDLLARRNYSKLKLNNKLREKGFDPTEIKDAIEKLEELNYIREDYYKRSQIINLMRKGNSVKFIKFSLKKEDQIEAQSNDILEVFAEFDLTEEDLIKKLIEKKITAEIKKNHDKIKSKNKILKFLQNKGHDWTTSSFLVDERLKVI